MKLIPRPATTRDLSLWYREINRRMFHNKLPKRVKIWFVPPGDAYADVRRDYFAEEYEILPGRKRRRIRTTYIPPVIRIHPRFQWSLRLALLPLLHEIVHIAHHHKLLPQVPHGLEFDRQMFAIREKVGGKHELWL